MFHFIDVSCNCGDNLARGVLVLHAHDARRITATLSSLCPICRDRISRPEPPVLSEPALLSEPSPLSEPRTSVSGSSAPKSEVSLVPA